MPGFTLIYQHQGLDKGITERTERLVRSSFKIQFISRTEKLMLIFRDGNNYPYEILETNEYILVIEGRIYGIDPLKDSGFLKKIDAIFRKSSFTNDTSQEQELAYFHQLDGEFIIYLIDRKGNRILVLNDFLGRLPQYYYEGNHFILSRDLYILDKITTGLLFEDTSIYQFLRLGFTLGNRTLYHDIHRLGYASLVRIDTDVIKMYSFPLDLEKMEGTHRPMDPAKELYGHFKKAISDRLRENETHVISLSGGLDSRLIMGEVEKQKMAADYATFVYDNPVMREDLAVSKVLGRHYNRSPHLYELNEYSPEAFDELIQEKGGMNYVGMAFLLRYLIDLGHNYGLMLTGDGGDKTLPYLFPQIKLKPAHLGSFILRQNEISSRKTLDSFLLSDVKAEERRLLHYLDNLPGERVEIKYKSFLLFERARNWLSEGEDRNRSYLWSTSPFYQPQFFQMAHALPEKLKRHFALYRSFTSLVDKNLNTIENANWGFPLSESKRLERMMFRQKIKSRLRLPFFKNASHLAVHGEMAGLIASLMHKGFGGQLSLYADSHDLKAASSETLFHLITLLKASEMTWKGV